MVAGEGKWVRTGAVAPSAPIQILPTAPSPIQINGPKAVHPALEGRSADATDPGHSRVYEGGRVRRPTGRSLRRFPAVASASLPPLPPGASKDLVATRLGTAGKTIGAPRAPYWRCCWAVDSVGKTIGGPGPPHWRRSESRAFCPRGSQKKDSEKKNLETLMGPREVWDRVWEASPRGPIQILLIAPTPIQINGQKAVHLALEGDFADAADPGDSRIYEGGRAKVEERNLGGGCPQRLVIPQRPKACLGP